MPWSKRRPHKEGINFRGISFDNERDHLKSMHNIDFESGVGTRENHDALRERHLADHRAKFDVIGHYHPDI